MIGFKKPNWKVINSLTYHYSCSMAVYGIIKQTKKGFEWEARMIYKYGTARGVSLDIKSAKKIVVLMIEKTKSSLILQKPQQKK